MRPNIKRQSGHGQHFRAANPVPQSSTQTTRSAPPGVKIIAGLGFIGSLFGLFGGLALLQSGAIGGLLGLVVVGISILHVFVMIGLLSMEVWAHGLALLLYGSGFLIDLVMANFLALVVGGVVILYLFGIRHRFHSTSRPSGKV